MSYRPPGDFTTDRSARLDDLRGALLAAAAADLASADSSAHAAVDPAPAPLPRPAAREPRILRGARARLAVALLAITVAVPGLTIATGMLGPDQAVANGLPAGTKVMVGTQPTCTALRAGVEYRCAFAVAPARGGVLRTVDSSGQVNGGCASQNVVETLWICYFGGAAIHHGVVPQGLL
jgi:hypothetical protein